MVGDFGLIGSGYGYGIGATLGTVDTSTPVAEADPTRDYVSWPPLEADLSAADREHGSLLLGGWHGAPEYERMYHTPAVGSSFNALRCGVLAGGVGLVPAVRAASAAGKPKEGQAVGSDLDAEMAVQVADSNRRTLDSWETPVDLVLWEMMEAMFLGHVMAEKTVVDVADGPDAGTLRIESLRTLPRHTYRFLLDTAGRVARVGAQTVDGWREFEADKFAWLTWDPKHGNPLGRSLFRMAHYHWRMLMDLWPEVYKGWKQFGVPYLYGTTAPGETMVTPRDAQGNEVPGKAAVTPEYAMAMRLAQLRNGSAVAGKHDSDVKVVESQKDSSVVSGAVAILEGQIIRAILLQLRATMEAQHGSKADSETGQDVMGTLIRFVRKWLERFLRSVLIWQNTLNYGPDVANRLTPLVDLGGAEHQDFAANAAGVANLWSQDFFTKEGWVECHTLLGFSPPSPDDERIGPADGPSAPGEATDPAQPADTAQGVAA